MAEVPGLAPPGGFEGAEAHDPLEGWLEEVAWVNGGGEGDGRRMR